MEFDDLVGGGLRDLLDVHAPRGGEDHHQAAGVSIQGDAEVDFALDVGGLLAPDLVDGEALDVHTQDGLSRRLCLLGRLRQPDPAGLAPAADGDLGLDCDRPQQVGRVDDLLHRPRHAALIDGNAGGGELLFGLVFEKLHGRRESLHRWG